MLRQAELDVAFGKVRMPAYLRDNERTAAFSKIVFLDDRLGEELNALLDLSRRFEAFQTVAFNICLLWAVDQEGHVFVAFEEVCLTARFETRFPRMRNMPLGAAVEALGHPLLVDRGAARIAGELIFDEEGDELFWIINNKSGRYGFGPGRDAAHLDNVAAEFARVGVDVQTHYIVGR